MEEIKSKQEKFIKEHGDHKSHLPRLRIFYKQLRELANRLNISNNPGIKPRIKSISCAHLLSSLEEMNRGILNNLETGLYSVVEALSRVAIEHSVNLIYLVEDPGHTRSVSLLKHHLDGSRKRALRWKEYAENTNMENDVHIAKEKLASIENQYLCLSDVLDETIPSWPINVRERFSLAGLEYSYHVLFSSASDSVHSLSEDIFNLTFVETIALEKDRANMALGLTAEKMSFAIYLAANAICFYGEAIMRIARCVEDLEIQKDIRLVGTKLQAILSEHNNLTASYWKD